MIEFIVELILTVILEIVGYFIFYNTGLIVLFIFTMGKFKRPIYLPGRVEKTDGWKWPGFNQAVITGILFYLSLIIAALWFSNLI